jgi:ribosomal-protein-serine acetyltransferase
MKPDALRADLGGGVSLRPIEDGDVAELFRLVDRNRAHLRQWMPWLDATQSEDDLRRWASDERRKAADGRSAQFVVLDGDEIAGVAGYHEIDWQHGQVELGYWLAADRQGKGLMTRAARELVRFAFEELGLNRVGIKTATGNARSRAIPERLGFRHEGVIRESERLYDRFVDLDVHGLLASEWRARPEPAFASRTTPHRRLELRRLT